MWFHPESTQLLKSLIPGTSHEIDEYPYLV